MKLCAAQLSSITGDIEGNIGKHCAFIQRAVEQGAALILFPELSLTHYAPSLAQGLATTPDDPRLDALQHLADMHGIIICAGLPVTGVPLPRIGMVIFQAHQPRGLYCKQHLHADELPWFSPGEGQALIRLGEHNLAPAICYESMLPEHADEAVAAGADFYLVSVAKSANGIAAGQQHYPAMARRHGMPLLMSNSIGPVEGFLTTGQSAAWNRQGDCLGTLPDGQEGLVLLDLESERVELIPGP